MTSWSPATPPKPTTQQVHPVAPPPANSTLVKGVATFVAADIAISSAAEGIEALLSPFGIGKAAIMAALGLSRTGTNATPRKRGSGEIPTAAATADTFYRAAYVINAARRLQSELDDGGTLAQALAQEAAYWRAHEAARRNRLDSAAAVARMAAIHGPLLGWYRDEFSNSEAECIAADGNNFYATTGTVIGYPGTVHPHCACTAGPPHAFGGMVNDAVAPIVKRVSTVRLLKLKRAAS